MLTAHLDDPTGYGRINPRRAGRCDAIVDTRDASDAQRRINEINTGMLAVSSAAAAVVAGLDTKNSQGEFYSLTSSPWRCATGVAVNTVHPLRDRRDCGINTNRSSPSWSASINCNKPKP